MKTAKALSTYKTWASTSLSNTQEVLRSERNFCFKGKGIKGS